MEMARWNGHIFTVSPEVIRGFTDMTIKGGSETEEKTSGGQKYAVRKAGNPTEITMTAELAASLGCDVKSEAMAFIEEARQGAKGYFYVAGKKLVTGQVMLTAAVVEEMAFMPDGTWTRCRVPLTFVLAEAEKAESTGSGSGSSGSSSSKQSVKTTSVSEVIQKAHDYMADTLTKAIQAKADAAAVTVQAKAASAKEKLTAKAGGGGSQLTVMIKD